MKLTGNDAIACATEHNLPLCKYSDPTEDWRDDLTIEEAVDVSREDPNLIYVYTEE